MFSLCFVDVLLSAVYNVDWWLMLSHVLRKIKWFEIWKKSRVVWLSSHSQLYIFHMTLSVKYYCFLGFPYPTAVYNSYTQFDRHICLSNCFLGKFTSLDYLSFYLFFQIDWLSSAYLLFRFILSLSYVFFHGYDSSAFSFTIHQLTKYLISALFHFTPGHSSIISVLQWLFASVWLSSLMRVFSVFASIILEVPSQWPFPANLLITSC